MEDDRDDAEDESGREERKGGLDVARTDAGAAPPYEEKENDGNANHGGFGEERADEGDERKGAPTMTFTGVKAKPPEDTRGGKQEREGVFSFRDPDGGGGRDRVNREGGGNEPGTGNVEAVEDAPEDKRRTHVEEEIDEVVSERIGAPELPLCPVEGVGQRPVVGETIGEPDREEAGG